MFYCVFVLVVCFVLGLGLASCLCCVGYSGWGDCFLDNFKIITLMFVGGFVGVLLFGCGCLVLDLLDLLLLRLFGFGGLTIWLVFILVV